MVKNSESSKSLKASFDRDFFGSDHDFSVIGAGEIGGKAQGLANINETLVNAFDNSVEADVRINIPRLTVVTTELFDKFMKRNKLYETALSDNSDKKIAHVFQKADFPAEHIGDLMALVQKVRTPLAVRSSSLLEDALHSPFAGVYATKMIPNNQVEPAKRFNKLVEAIKFVWASTFFNDAKTYIKHIGRKSEDEKMAVIIQEVVGKRYKDRFYPNISGVARSYNYYPTGRAKPDQGVVDLALGLGKTIVDGGKVWTYSPAFPKINPPCASNNELLNLSQRKFWAVNMGPAPAYDPIKETEYMVQADLDNAAEDETLKYVASTYNAASDRMSPGIGIDGPRLINFGMLLIFNDIPLNDIIKKMLKLCEEKVGKEVEIEFALTLDPKKGTPSRIGFLQVRPMLVSDETIDISEEMVNSSNVLAFSEKVMGNGENSIIKDIIYLRPESFEAKNTPKIAFEIEKFNREMIKNNRTYLLFGFGRWGSSDPWLGIPVNWSQVSNAKAIVESTLENMNVDLSQGSHFFHNLSSFQISYFSIHHDSKHKINWDWLNKQTAISQTDNIRHVRLEKALNIKVDGRTGRGIIRYDEQ